MEFKDRLKELREFNQLTQKELSEKLKIAQSSISKYESGQLDVNTDALKKIANFFDVSIDYLLGNSNEKKSSSNIAIYEKNLLNELGAYYRVFKVAKDSKITAEQIEEQLLLWRKYQKKED